MIVRNLLKYRTNTNLDGIDDKFLSYVYFRTFNRANDLNEGSIPVAFRPKKFDENVFVVRKVARAKVALSGYDIVLTCFPVTQITCCTCRRS